MALQELSTQRAPALDEGRRMRLVGQAERLNQYAWGSTVDIITRLKRARSNHELASIIRDLKLQRDINNGRLGS